MTDISPDFREFLKSIKGKRSKIVIDHILEHGFVTTEDLETLYGYKHPPRAIRDVREQGVPLESFSVKNVEGRTIAAYRFDLSTALQSGKLGGRKIFPKRLKVALISRSNGKCEICATQYDARYLQIDHRIPYEVLGDIEEERDHHDYMLLCGSCNRAKSWSCEHCENWLKRKDPNICRTCYWASPENYQHIATHQLRRVELVWAETEIEVYQQLVTLAANTNLADYLKNILADYVIRSKNND